MADLVGNGKTKPSYHLRAIDKEKKKNTSRYDGMVLNIQIRYPLQFDSGPIVFSDSKYAGFFPNINLRLPGRQFSVSGAGDKKAIQYECWSVDRCILLHKVCGHPLTDKKSLLVHASASLARCAAAGLSIYDSKLDNLGIRLGHDEYCHEVCVLDAGGNAPASNPLRTSEARIKA